MVSLSIKTVPEPLVKALRLRASTNHRSIQGELMHILETALRPKPFRARYLLERAQELGLSSTDEAVTIVRQGRDR